MDRGMDGNWRKTSLLGPETLKQFEEREGSEESLEAFETETQVKL